MNIAQLVLAVTFAHSFHILGEVMNVRNKLTRLTDAIAKKSLRPYPMNIDTRAKSYTIGFLMFIIVAVVAYLLLNILSFTEESLLIVALSLIVVTEIVNTVRLDTYHVQIEKLIKKFSKSS